MVGPGADDDIEVILKSESRCASCGHPARPGVAFCTGCGARFSPPGSSEAPAATGPGPARIAPGRPAPTPAPTPPPTPAPGPATAAGGQALPPLAASAANRARPAARPAASRPAPRPSSSVSAGEALFMIGDVAFSVGKAIFYGVGLIVIVLMIFGYSHAHTAEFRDECTLYQNGIGSMDFPDNLLCHAFYERRY